MHTVMWTFKVPAGTSRLSSSKPLMRQLTVTKAFRLDP